MRVLSSLIIVLLVASGFTIKDNETYEAIHTVEDVFESTKQIQTLKYEFVRKERIDDKMVENHSYIKMQRRPYKIYLKEMYPNEGVEALFPHPTDDSKALINPNGFPWVSLKLDPTGELMRRNQHHTLLQGGFDYVMSVMEFIFYKYQADIMTMVSYEGTELVSGIKCEKITLNNPSFSYKEYVVKEGESINSIAKKHRLNEYLIIQKNDNLGLFHEVTQGDVLMLPTDYSAKMTLYIDKLNNLPLKMMIYDEVGLFESYEFRNVDINPKIANEEFQDSFLGYEFN